MEKSVFKLCTTHTRSEWTRKLRQIRLTRIQQLRTRRTQYSHSTMCPLIRPAHQRSSGDSFTTILPHSLQCANCTGHDRTPHNRSFHDRTRRPRLFSLISRSPPARLLLPNASYSTSHPISCSAPSARVSTHRQRAITKCFEQLPDFTHRATRSRRQTTLTYPTNSDSSCLGLSPPASGAVFAACFS